MAQWIGTARSNYFRVKDEQAFREAIECHEMRVVTDDEGRFAILSEDEYGGWPGWEYPDSAADPDSDGEPIEIDVAKIVSEHLKPDEVAVLLEVGAEKLRYITGHAVAVNDKNEQRVVNLDSIYTVALELGGNVSQAAY